MNIIERKRSFKHGHVDRHADSEDLKHCAAVYLGMYIKSGSKVGTYGNLCILSCFFLGSQMKCNSSHHINVVPYISPSTRCFFFQLSLSYKPPIIILTFLLKEILQFKTQL